MAWSRIPWVDIGAVLLAAWYMRESYRRGFAASILDAGGFIAGFAGALLAYAPAAGWVSARFGIARPFAKTLAFFVLLVILQYAAHHLAVAIGRRIPARALQSRANRYLGLVPGFVDAAVIAAVALPIVLSLPMPRAVKTAIQDSPVGAAAVRASGTLDAAFTGVFGDAAKESLTFVTVKEGTEGSVNLEFRTDGFASDAAAEERLIGLVNGERVRRGLKPLSVAPALTALARSHAADMLSRGYFSHVTPEGRTPTARAEAAGYSYRAFGENLALAPDVALAHQGLMDSPGHRANVLSPDFGRIGIGIQDAGVYGLMVVQEFSD